MRKHFETFSARMIDIAAQSEATEVPGHCFRVINLNKLEVLSIRPIRGMIHDFRESQAGSVGRRA